MKRFHLIIVMFIMASLIMLGCSTDQSTSPMASGENQTGLEIDGNVTPNPGTPPPPPPPPPGDEGCTPGYWKNHIENWSIDPDLTFFAVFGENWFGYDLTLAQAVRLGGGGVKKLARHGTAAYVSAMHPDVHYPITPEMVIIAVQSGFDDLLAMYNELGCPLDN